MLEGRLALVTGAGSGIGRAICKKFAGLGASVVAADVKKVEVEETCAALAKGSTQYHLAVHCDVSGVDFVTQLRQAVMDHYKRPPSILVNNAGITIDARLHRMTEQQFDWVMAVNLKGTFLVTQAFTEAMILAQLKNCSVINISSMVGKTGNFGQANYAASKAAVIGLTKSVAKELGSQGIRVNAILPGFIASPMTAKVPEKILEVLKRQIPMGRMGEPDEVADVCVFLASDMSRYMTGASVEVSGGLGM